MAAKKTVKKEAAFNAASLTKEQQEAVVEEYLGVHPHYFLYEGKQIQLNISQLEYDERQKNLKTGEPRKWFNGWKPNMEKYRG